MKYVNALRLAIKVFSLFAASKEASVFYARLELRGVPYATVLVGTGREAWRIALVAIESFHLKGV